MSGRCARIAVVTIDRLGIQCLPPYGATWNDAPGWNLWGAKSLVCEQAIADGIDLQQVFASYWTGRHAARHASTRDQAAWSDTLPQLLAACQWSSRLFTDDPGIADLGERMSFSDVALFQDHETQTASGEPDEVELAKLLDATALGRVFAAAWPYLFESQKQSLTWIHLRGLGSAWDAPYAWREALCEEDDPAPPRDTAPPSRRCGDACDPDERWGVMRGYAAQIRLLDGLLSRTWERIAALFSPGELQIVLTSPRGFALGDHTAFGPEGDGLSSELLRVPLFLTDRTDASALARTQAIVQPADVFATCLDAAGAADVSLGDGHSLRPLATGLLDTGAWPRNRAFSVAADEDAITTAAWFLTRKRGLERDVDRIDLFVQPDDAFDANPIGSRRPAIVDTLTSQLDEFAGIVREGKPLGELPPLSSEAESIWR